ncbi:hypothetical protein BC827DRAFT_1225124, partial [Russula dissimulans]
MDGSREYELSVRQQPKQARMCGVGGTALRPSFSFFCFLFCFFLFVFFLFLF